jgi:two-component system nitrogen regulation response regulator NtrX
MRTLSQIVESAEREAIATALLEHGNNVSRAAKALGVERTNLHKKMRKHGLRGQGYEGARLKARACLGADKVRHDRAEGDVF